MAKPLSFNEEKALEELLEAIRQIAVRNNNEARLAAQRATYRLWACENQ